MLAKDAKLISEISLLIANIDDAILKAAKNGLNKLELFCIVTSNLERDENKVKTICSNYEKRGYGIEQDGNGVKITIKW